MIDDETVHSDQRPASAAPWPPNNSKAEAKQFPEARRRWLTIPNSLCFARFLGSFVLLGIALLGYEKSFAGLFLLLALTDWLDGKLAILLDQRSIYGTRLDSIADVTMYIALLIGGVALEWRVLSREWIWIAVAVGSYAAAAAYGFGKFRAVPSYHTRSAKASWLLVTVGALCLLLDISVWPFRVAMAGVFLANLESIAITWCSDEQRFNVKSIYHALRKG